MENLQNFIEEINFFKVECGQCLCKKTTQGQELTIEGFKQELIEEGWEVIQDNDEISFIFCPSCVPRK